MPSSRDRDLAGLFEILDVAGLRAVAHSPLHQILGPAQKPLPIGEALSAGIQAAIDDMHSASFVCSSGPIPRMPSERPDRANRQ